MKKRNYNGADAGINADFVTDFETAISAEGNIAAGALLDLGLLAEGAEVIRLINTSNVILEIGLGVNATAFNGNTSTLNGAGTIEIDIEDIEDFESTGGIVLLRNQSTGVAGSYQVQVLG